jgi:hypothetical protein
MQPTDENGLQPLLTQPIVRPKASLGARLFSVAIGVYVIAWIAEFIFITKVFGPKNAIALSFLSVLPFLLSVYMRCRWKSLKPGDWLALVLLLAVTIEGAFLFSRGWYEAGWHYRRGEWTFFTPKSEEDRAWDEFSRVLHKEPGFRFITHRRFRGVNWLKGSLESEADLERLIELAKKCGIKDEHLDGPYQHSISITIPGTKRAKEYH